MVTAMKTDAVEAATVAEMTTALVAARATMTDPIVASETTMARVASTATPPVTTDMAARSVAAAEVVEDTMSARRLQLVVLADIVKLLPLARKHMAEAEAEAGRMRTVVTITASLVRLIADLIRAETVLRC